MSEAIFIQGSIFAHKYPDIATWNILGVFLQTDNPDYILMHSDSILAELMAKFAPGIYQKYIPTNAKCQRQDRTICSAQKGRLGHDEECIIIFP